MNAWERYKARLGDTRPWDVLDKSVDRVDDDESERRYSICRECPRLIKATKQCRECGCVMPLKVKIRNAECPLNKW